jgi:hypothetical protein
MTRMKFFASIVGTVGASLGANVQASIVTYTNQSAWEAATGPSTYIGFTEYAVGTPITTQYAPLGVTFTDGDDTVYPGGGVLFPIDSRGLIGDFGGFGFHKPITAVFDAPRFAVAAHFAGGSIIQLYLGSQFVGQTGIFTPAFTGPFGGITSTVPFDRVVLDNGSTIGIDSLFFGSAVPGPGGFGALALASVCLRGRRRQR